MALKRKIDEDTFKALAKDVQKEYTKDGEHYVLDYEDADASELKRAKDRATEDAREAKKALKTLQAKFEELEEQAGDADKNKDVAKLTKAFEAKLKVQTEALAELKDSYDKKLSVRDAATKAATINATAKEIATKISTVPVAMSKLIAERLDVEIGDDGTTKLVVVGADGKASNMTLEQLSKEFVANKELAGMIVGSKASGSGAPRSGTERGSAPKAPGGDDEKVDLSKLNPKDLTALLKAKREQNADT